MKKAVLLFVFSLALSGAIDAQMIKASPFEGRWVWDGEGEDDMTERMTELFFFGNIMLSMYGEIPLYKGNVFTYTNRVIRLDNDILQYRLDGNTLTITDEDEQFTYTKVKTTKSPLEGLWKMTADSGRSSEVKDDEFMLFVADIMAISGGQGGYFGYKIDFNGRQFRPSLICIQFMRERRGKTVSEEELKEMTMEYSLSGKTLTITFGNEKASLTRVY